MKRRRRRSVRKLNRQRIAGHAKADQKVKGFLNDPRIVFPVAGIKLTPRSELKPAGSTRRVFRVLWTVAQQAHVDARASPKSAMWVSCG